MDGLALITQARSAGLSLSVIAGKLVIKGPPRLDSLAKLVMANKAAVVAALSPSSPGPAVAAGVGVTETQPSPLNHRGFADSVVAKRQDGKDRRPLVSPTIPPEILADPIVLCPRCASRRVLSELRTVTGGICYPCWEQEGRQ